MSGYAPVLIYSACGVDSLCHAMFFCFHRGINIWDREVENRVKFFLFSIVQPDSAYMGRNSKRFFESW